MREFIRHATLTVHYGDSLAVECTSVVHSFLQCIMGLNECTREHPLWFRTPLKMAVPSNSALFEGIGGRFRIQPRSQGKHRKPQTCNNAIFIHIFSWDISTNVTYDLILNVKKIPACVFCTSTLAKMLFKQDGDWHLLVDKLIKTGLNHDIFQLDK